MKINYYALKAIYLHEMDRFRRTLTQSLLSPVLTTFIVFLVSIDKTNLKKLNVLPKRCLAKILC